MPRASRLFLSSTLLMSLALAQPAARQGAAVPQKPKPDAQSGNVMYKTPDIKTWTKTTEEGGRLVFSAPMPPPDFVTLSIYPGWAKMAGDFEGAFDAHVFSVTHRLGVIKVERDGGNQASRAAEGFPVLQRAIVGETSQFHVYLWLLGGNPGERFDFITFETSSEQMYNFYLKDATAFFASVKLANSLQPGFKPNAPAAAAPAASATRPAPAPVTPATRPAPAPAAPATRPPPAPVVAAAPAPAAAGPAAQPAAARTTGGITGLFFMTRYWSFNSTLEKAAWYFAPDGRFYQNLAEGFSAADLAAHAGPKGTYRVTGTSLVVTWSDGKATTSQIEPDSGGFAWDGGLFVPVTAFAGPAAAAGTYEGGESLSHGGNTVAVSKDLMLRADGTFTWEGIGFVQGTTDRSTLVGGAQSGTTGRWRLDGYSIVLTDTTGKVIRGIAFPYEMDANKKPWMFFAGMMYKPR